ncbi:DUF4270 domain-containing protein [Niabella sp. CC-SYL272]|uniref:DUF4270 family protein n=1 Tax=Niabella agricola TaxID=2891571 RepID=UPI001F300B02|nr:DUF4270 family protein [Niabella agricola]MCF3107969.1 DUF4270 domain-containing protein [Niabella agricola]
MKKRHFFALGLFILATGLIVSCSKINLATELGQGLIPEVDNIHTFDTTLEVESFNKLFTAENDSFKTLWSDRQFLGVISNDPVFGKTDARMYFQLLPANGKKTLAGAPGKRYIDSIVLSLRYAGTYGDTALAQTIQVSEINQATQFHLYNTRDTNVAYSVRDNSWLTTAGVLGNASIVPFKLKDSTTDIRVKDTIKIANQLRIRLNQAFGQRLLDYDSTGANDAYSSDSVFKTKFNGFALQSVNGGNALLGFVLADTNTRVSVYYRFEKTDAPGDIDTAVAVLNLANQSAAANYIGRDYNGTQIISATSDDIQDNILYIQNTPGSYANLKIPGLKTFPKSIIHLAELQMESIYDASDTVFNAPGNMFLDVYDSTASKYKLLPYAFQINSSGGLSGYDAFFSARTQGQTYYYKKDPLSNNSIKQWRFNLTPYVQRLLTGAVPLYTMRLYAPAYSRLSLGDPGISADLGAVKFVIPPAAATSAIPGVGRVRIGGGQHPTQKMKLRIVYSKL